MQAARLQEVLAEWEAAVIDAQVRAAGNADDGAVTRAYHDQRDPAMQPRRVPSWALQMQMTTEADFLMVAIRNLLRVQDRLPTDLLAPMHGQEILELIRNVSEHFDERGGRSETTLATNHPRVLTNAITFTRQEVWLGGNHGVPLSRVQAWASRVNDRLLAALARSEVEVPASLAASTVAGDDELEWPADRLHFGWWLPTVDESEWPEGEIPHDILEIIAERFANLRARDNAD